MSGLERVAHKRHAQHPQLFPIVEAAILIAVDEGHQAEIASRSGVTVTSAPALHGQVGVLAATVSAGLR